MSAFVLEGKYQLQLPSSFVDIDSEEMEYVDGGSLTWWEKGLVVAAVAAISAAVIYTCGAILVGGFSAVMSLGPVEAIVNAVGAKAALTGFLTSTGIGVTISIAVGNWLRDLD